MGKVKAILYSLIFSYNTLLFSDFSTLSCCIPVKVFNNLDNSVCLQSYYTELKNKEGVYSFYNKINNKQYIGSSVDLYKRMFRHIRGVKSNIALQRAMNKYGLTNFYFYIYKFYSHRKNKTLVETETQYIQKFYFEMRKSESYAFPFLYNFKKTATSFLGYKHTEDSILKMKQRLKDKTNHPMYGKKHSIKTKNLVSKKAKAQLNPMYNRQHTKTTKKILSLCKSKYIVQLYDINVKLLLTFNNNVELANYLSINKSTVGKYIKSQKLFQNKYYFKREKKISNYL
jgi:group I intron endonuclease